MTALKHKMLEKIAKKKIKEENKNKMKRERSQQE